MTEKKNIFFEVLKSIEPNFEKEVQTPAMYHKIEEFTKVKDKDYKANTNKGEGMTSNFYRSKTYTFNFHKPISRMFSQLNNHNSDA